MINIAYVLTPIEFGGAERVSLNMIKTYDKGTFNIVPILLIRPWESLSFFAKELQRLNIKYLTIPIAKKAIENGKDYFRILRCYYYFFSILTKKNFDLIHTNGYLADIIGIPLAKILKIPHLATCHGFIDNDKNLKLYNRLDINFLKFSNKIISVSGELKKK